MGRVKWKGPFINFDRLNKEKLAPRNLEITSEIVNRTFNVHNGKKVSKLNITSDMVGFKIGEFVPTRAKFEFKKKKKKSTLKKSSAK